MRRLKLLLIALVPVAVILLVTPFLARWGTSKEVARWSSTNSVYGLKRPIWLGIQRDVAYVDVFGWYPSYRLFITDGGYAYVRDLNVPSTDYRGYLARCRVDWQTNGAEFITSDADRYFIPFELILRQIGPN